MNTDHKSEEITYKEVNGTSYHSETPDDLVRVLESLRQTKERVILVYGDPSTCTPFPRYIPERGRIGRSSGKYKIPLLVRTSRSLGGEGILDHCIIQIKKSKGGEIIYELVQV